MNAVAGAILVLGISAAAFALAVSNGEHLLARTWAVLFVVALVAFVLSARR
jgi:hypothetical protein